MNDTTEIQSRRKRVIEELTTLALAPVLLAQGLYVRRRTPRLAEPPGARAGVAGSGPELRLLIAGDSAAAGVGATTQQEALSGHLVTALGNRHRVHWKLVARTGLRIQAVIERLRAEQASAFDVVVLSVGVNDVTGGTSAKRWAERVDMLIAVLKQRFGAQYIVFTTVPPMDCFPALPPLLGHRMGLRARRFNLLLAQAIAKEPCCTLLQWELPFDLGYMADDGFHPGRNAYAAWGQLAAERIDEFGGLSAR